MVRVDTQYIERYRHILEKNIHLINPCTRMTLEQWIVDYEYVIFLSDFLPLISDKSVHQRIFFRTFRLFDTEGIASHKDSWDLIDFKNLILRQIAKARRDLYKFWYTGIQDIYLEVK